MGHFGQNKNRAKLQKATICRTMGEELNERAHEEWTELERLKRTRTEDEQPALRYPFNRQAWMSTCVVPTAREPFIAIQSFKHSYIFTLIPDFS